MIFIPINNLLKKIGLNFNEEKLKNVNFEQFQYLLLNQLKLTAHLYIISITARIFVKYPNIKLQEKYNCCLDQIYKYIINI